MTKKPRGRPRLTERTKSKHEEFRNCDAPSGCPNIVSIVDRPKAGPVYCVLHIGMANAK